MITNDAGEVALKIWPPVQKVAQQVPSGKGYIFIIRADIAMSWIDPQDLDNLLSRTCSCNCGNGSSRKCFMYANESDVRRWQNNGGS